MPAKTDHISPSLFDYHTKMTTELKPFTRFDLEVLLLEEDRKNVEKKYVAEHVDSIVKTAYTEVLRRVADPTISRYETNVCNHTSDLYRAINEIAISKLRDLFPDFHVEGSYRALGGNNNWSIYEICITW